MGAFEWILRGGEEGTGGGSAGGLTGPADPLTVAYGGPVNGFGARG